MSFTSRTVRAIKADGLEDRDENYGQTARYKGTIPEMPRYFDLTDEIRLIKGRDVAISGNMAEMLAQSRYGAHFDIKPRGAHRGEFAFQRAQDAVAARRGKEGGRSGLCEPGARAHRSAELRGSRRRALGAHRTRHARACHHADQHHIPLQLGVSPLLSGMLTQKRRVHVARGHGSLPYGVREERVQDHGHHGRITRDASRLQLVFVRSLQTRAGGRRTRHHQDESHASRSARIRPLHRRVRRRRRACDRVDPLLQLRGRRRAARTRRFSSAQCA